MLDNVLKNRVQLQEKVSTYGPLGETVVWKYIRDLYGRRIALNTMTAVQFQQLDTKVSDKFIFRGTVDIELGKHRLLYRTKIYEPQQTAKQYDGVTEVLVLEM